MAITVAQIKSVIIGRVGDIDPATLDPTTLNSGLLALGIDVWWDVHADKDLWGPRLRELYTQIECLDAKIAAWMVLVDFQDGATSMNMKQNQKVAMAQIMRQNVLNRIAALEETYAKSFRSGGSIKQLIRTAPVMPPVRPIPGPVDQNDPRYSGSTYLPSPDPI